jgi:hypothetical protein
VAKNVHLPLTEPQKVGTGVGGSFSGHPSYYGASGSQISAIYENFLRFAVSVLLLCNFMFLFNTYTKKKGNRNRYFMLKKTDPFPFS